jgi:formylglycine-generating enzyme required for sulfatase activity
MKKGKQDPFFSRLQETPGEAPPATPTRTAPLQNHEETPAEVSLEARDEVASSLEITSRSGADAGESEDLTSDEPAVELVIPTPKIIQPVMGVDHVVNSLGMTFVLIPAGTFLMGSPEHEPGRNDDETQHEVTISQSFRLQNTPVTQAQWQTLMGKNPSSFSQGGGDYPVDGINWHDCQAFIKKLNALGEGVYRLPTEAEWEYACRAGSENALPNGELTSLYCDPDPNLEELGWYCGNSESRTQPVAQKSRNAWGLYDMWGNVAEWCQDWHGPYPETPQTDPGGPVSGIGRVVRGGSWFSSAKNCRSAARFHWPPHCRNQLHILGFRLVQLV